PTSAQAMSFPPSPRDVHKRVVHDVRRVLEVPRTIHRGHVGAFRSFYRGNTYYAPHHHYHAVYRYPAYGIGGRVSYRPYYYCNNSLFITGGYYSVPRIAVNVGPGGYYYYAPAPLPPPPPRYYPRYDDRRYDDRYDHRYDDRYDHDRDDDDHQGNEGYDD